MASRIPIRNIYYLLCYAWDSLTEGGLVDVSELDSTELADLFAAVLINGTNHLARRGIDHGYQTIEGELSSIRGRVNVAMSARRMLLAHGRALCVYDDFNANTLPNRILKATIRKLIGVPALDATLRNKLKGLQRSLNGIDDIPLTKLTFRKVQLHGNNRFYRFLLNVCELVNNSWLIDEATGKYQFRDFLREDRQMAALFEHFVLNFYKIECAHLKVKKERIYWAASSQNDPDLKFLPTMETDISLRDHQRTIIIDTKYYSETLQDYFDVEKIRSAHLYQLFAYLTNLEARGGVDAYAEGMLLYPVVQGSLRLNYEMHGHKVSVCTVDLSKDWRSIKSELVALVTQ